MLVVWKNGAHPLRISEKEGKLGLVELSGAIQLGV